jgi:hypothetical protein
LQELPTAMVPVPMFAQVQYQCTFKNLALMKYLKVNRAIVGYNSVSNQNATNGSYVMVSTGLQSYEVILSDSGIDSPKVNWIKKTFFLQFIAFLSFI